MSKCRISRWTITCYGTDRLQKCGDLAKIWFFMFGTDLMHLLPLQSADAFLIVLPARSRTDSCQISYVSMNKAFAVKQRTHILVEKTLFGL